MTRKQISSVNAWALAAATATGLLTTACVTDVEVDGPTDPSAPTDPSEPSDPSGPSADDGKFVRSPDPISDSYIVVLEDDKALRSRGEVMDVAAVSGDLSAIYAARLSEAYTAVSAFSAEMNETDARALAQDPRVRYVQENGRKSINATQSNATWGLDRIDQRDRPLSTTYTYNNDAAGVTAYVIDTGIRRTHTQFGNRAVHGFSAFNDNNSNDCQGHGTHVAGTVGGSIHGVAKGVRLVAVRVLDCNGSGSDAGVIAGINWVTQNASGPSVANMSLGGGDSVALDDAVKRSIAAGITYAVAAGNDSANACSGSPNKVPEAITVGSSTSGDGRSSFSNHGSCLDIFAPGSSITSASRSSDTATTTMSGTSMASPHVAGAAALVLAANPSFTPRQVRDALVNNASTGKLSNILTGSPNALLYTGFIGGGNPDPDPDPDPGQPKTFTETSSVTLRQFKQYSARRVKAGSVLKATLTGVSGDPDLYVRLGAAPTTTQYNCRPYLDSGVSESCTINVEADTDAYVGVRGYSAGGYTITIEWVEP